MRQITKNWFVNIDSSFQRRVEDGSLVFWQPGKTVWINCWGDGNRPTKLEAIQAIRQEAAPNRRQILDGEDGEMFRFVYALTETEGGTTRYAAYSFTLVEDEYLQMAVYFDSLGDRQWALDVATTPIYQKSPPEA